MSRKGENIYKRKDGRWEGRYMKSRTPGGKTHYGYVYAKTYREAKIKLMEAIAIRNEAGGCASADKNPEVFRDTADEWLLTLRPQIKESTYNKYRNILEAYVYPELGRLPLSRITNDTIEFLCSDLLINGGIKKSGLSSKTVSDVLSVIRSVLKYADKKGKAISCNAQSVQVKRRGKEMRVLSRSEQDKLCQYLYSDLTPYNIGILVCLFTGLRVGEICALCWKDISLADRTMHIHQTMQRIQDKMNPERKTKLIVTTPKSPCSIRTIPIPGNLVGIIAGYRTSSEGYFLTNSTQKYVEPRTMQYHFKRALKNSYVDDANYHSLRHTFATRCVEVGFDVKSLSEILGHASVTITMNRYVHPSMELKKENMQRLSALLAVK